MKTIVILGTGLAAVPVIHQTMKSTVLNRRDLKMIVVSPNTHFVWTIAMPRAIVPGQFTDEKVLYELQPTFKEYPAEKFEFVLGTTRNLDPVSKTVTITLNAAPDSTRSIAYDTLIIATGAASHDDMPWKASNNTEDTISKLHSVQDKIQTAETIVVAGGGITGVEAVGELGYEYSRNGSKKVYFIHTDDLPLSPIALPSVRRQVRTELDRLKVMTIPNTKVTTVSTKGSDTILELTAADGTTTKLTAQAYIPCLGVVPNTSFAPASILNANGYIKQTTSLQVENHPDIFVLGDAGSLEDNRATIAELQALHLIAALPLHLDGKPMAEYKPAEKPLLAITVGRGRGTGQVFNFKVFSFVVWYMKGRLLGTDYADALAAGKRTLNTKLE
ncbi:hypothetical protein NQ176_g283 [Zarea fungicola]|uniref:Uncharacterized protein n=1 Tax=Zarea fungicola TaxID=93591 RepID=A0ACC1NYZ0_9HYPO|nr:hypothetical protein NQ176_g283 [Lecanicillium fungicola]